MGTAEVIDCIGPLTVKEFNDNLRKIGAKYKIKSKSDFYYETTYAWVLKNAKRLKKPIKYKHKMGIVVWHPVKM